MFSDNDEMSPSIATVSALLVACSMLVVQQQKRLCLSAPLLTSNSHQTSVVAMSMTMTDEYTHFIVL